MAAGAALAAVERLKAARAQLDRCVNYRRSQSCLRSLVFTPLGRSGRKLLRAADCSLLGPIVCTRELLILPLVPTAGCPTRRCTCLRLHHTGHSTPLSGEPLQQPKRCTKPSRGTTPEQRARRKLERAAARRRNDQNWGASGPRRSGAEPVAVPPPASLDDAAAPAPAPETAARDAEPAAALVALLQARDEPAAAAALARGGQPRRHRHTTTPSRRRRRRDEPPQAADALAEESRGATATT